MPSQDTNNMENLRRYFKQAIFGNDSEKLEKRFPNSYIHSDSYVSDFVEVGLGTRINGPAYIQARKQASVVIGRYVAIAHNLKVRTRNHSLGYANIQDRLQKECGFNMHGTFKGSVTIGSCSWIGDSVIILPGASIGEGAVIGAGSVVTKEIPPCAVAIGSPARVIRNRFSDEVIEQYMSIQWWNWPLEKIKLNQVFFETDLSKCDNVDLNSLITS